MRQLLYDVYASLQSRRDSLPAASKARSQTPSAAVIPPCAMTIARRTATPASGTVRSARRRHVLWLQANSCAVDMEGSKRSISDPLFDGMSLDTFLIVTRIEFVVFVLFLCSFWGRLIRGSRAGESQLKNASCPARGF